MGAGSSRLWKDPLGGDCEDLIGGTDLVVLNRLSQQRHVIAHKGGIVDADSIARSGDTSYAVNQRVVTNDHAVIRPSELVLDPG